MIASSAALTPSKPQLPKPSLTSKRALHARLTTSPRQPPTRSPKAAGTAPNDQTHAPKEVTRLTHLATQYTARTTPASVETMLPSQSGFIYLEASMSDAYTLEVLPERPLESGRSREQGEVLTLSHRGVLRSGGNDVRELDPEMTTLPDFVREHELYNQLKQLNVFGQYSLWKPMRRWRDVVNSRRFHRRRQLVKERLLLNDARMQSIITQCASLCHTFAEEQRAVDCSMSACETGEFVRIQLQRLAAFSVAKRAAEEQMTALIRAEALEEVSELLKRMKCECSVEFAVECCNLTIAEQLMRRHSINAPPSVAATATTVSPTSPHIVKGILSGEVVGSQARQEQRNAFERQQKRGGGGRNSRRRSQSLLIQQARRASQEELRKTVLAYMEKKTLNKFGQRLKRAVRTADFIWANAIRQSVLMSLQATMQRVSQPAASIAGAGTATPGAMLKLFVTVASHQTTAQHTAKASFTPSYNEFIELLKSWIASLMEESKHEHTLVARPPLGKLMAMSGEDLLNPGELQKVERPLLELSEHHETLANALLENFSHQYTVAADSLAVYNEICDEYAQNLLLERTLAVARLKDQTAKGIAAMLTRWRELTRRYNDIPSSTTCGCLYLDHGPFLQEVRRSNEACVQQLRQLLPVLFEEQFNHSMANIQATQQFLSIKPDSLATYVSLATRFREISSIKLPLLNDEYEHVVDLADLLREAQITGDDDRKMQLLLLERTKFALLDDLQAADNLLGTQVQHYTTELVARSRGLSAPTEEIMEVLNSSALATPDTASSAALTMIAEQARKLASVHNEAEELAYFHEAMGMTSLDMYELADCSALLSRKRAMWELRARVDTTLEDILASPQNSVDLEEIEAIVADTQAQAVRLHQDREENAEPTESGANLGDTSVLMSVATDCSKISRLLALLRMLRRPDFWDLDARCHSEAPCKFVFANPSLTVKTLIELKIPSHVDSILSEFPLPV